MSEMRKDICFNKQLKKEFIETLNFMVGVIPVLKTENNSSNEMVRLVELINTKTEDLSSLERAKQIVTDKDARYVISSEISKVKKSISRITKAKGNMANSFLESTEKVKLYRTYANAKWEYFKKLNFVFSKEEIESLTDELLICYFLFEGMGSSFDRTKGIVCSKDNENRLTFVKAYEESWDTFLEWIYNNIDL